MSDASSLQMLKYVGSGTQHTFQQLHFRPGPRSAFYAHTRWRRADRVAGTPDGTVGNGRQQALDRCRQCLKGARSWRPLPTKLNGHQIGSGGEVIDHTECGQAAYERQLPVSVNLVLIGDQSAVGSSCVRTGHLGAILGDKG
jgi:hypothetical protein